MYSVLPVRALLQGLRRRARFECLSDAQRRVLGRAEDGVLESEFAGNLVEVCPTGVFTDKTSQAALYAQMGPADGAFYLRPLRSGMQHHRGGALRHAAADCEPVNGEVNGYFLCDRGRFGYEFVNSSERIRILC